MVLQMACRIHALMQNADDGNAIAGYADINRVPSDFAAPVAGPNLLACRCCLGRACQVIKGCCHAVKIMIGLLYAPALYGISPERLKIMLGGGRQPEFSLAPPAFSA